MVTDEEWRPIPGYEGRYEASSRGRIRSLGFYSGNRWGTRTWRAGRVLRQALISGTRHYAVGLVDAGGHTRTMKVHRLVLLAFRGSPPPGQPDGLHEDDDASNNNLYNLRWGNDQENQLDSVRNGSHVQARKDTCCRGHALVAPNLVESTVARGGRSCLACKLARANMLTDQALAAEGRSRTRVNRGRDGFMRRLGESWEDEADRRYKHIMRHPLGL